MLKEDQYMERTPDLIAKIRRLREAAQREIDKFTRVADYDMRRVVGQKPKASPVSDETVPPSLAHKRTKKSAAGPMASQASIEFLPAPAERDGDKEDDDEN